MTVKVYTPEELKQILELHRKWWRGEAGGIRADLRSADLGGANLRSANLRSADLRSADLGGADLRSADLRSADLRSANLRSADLRSADLGGADLAAISPFQLCPEGPFIGWKKVRGGVVLKLEILGERTSSLLGRKCRTSAARVLEAFATDDEGKITGPVTDGRTEFRSKHTDEFIYRLGEVASEPRYDSDIREECTSGIHFFITRDEAAGYW